ncbi:DNA-binding transcriptional regulator LsrR (DeoR family) [Chromobacterium alkanivorans]|uniref:sugar-binding transcriptional regulator n=1 Tax=Chromobacterium alkanivorans TaxID=1071719 RepID=UPI0021672FB3|nr:sugar-binding transcriptional regulator [Chromobacterium alkanivorans]MCS3804708.1 DNA-binding transcriptional regulator LsrR (DeoR family) [Chromobacterium alkanivorans]MCS3819048.1 DNA-binding transcriptional regulator LsrR (DeoR family) [Chromobacterium alkanivorans]MCS3873095.1 DNA-binding transcriptional regulator LsrR (DeoR family) [Chromobacterium alkanivorans]
MTQDELTELATLYYVDNHTQEALAKRFGISRATVSRMLRKAQEEGVVEIRVRQHPAYANGLEQELRQRFGIQRAIIAIDHQDGDKQRALLAAQVAAYLDQTLDDGMVVAVGMGRNISAVSDYISTPARRECAFISAIGGAYRGGETMNSDHICRRLAARFGGESETLYAPALIRDPALRQSLLENDTVRQTLDRARRADLALIGIGDLSEDSNIVRMGWFSPTEIAEAKRSGTIGDVMGYDFFDIYGQPAGTPLQGRIVGLHLGDLERIPNVVAIASEQSKATALLGALRTGVIDTLATTTVNAMTVISLDDITRKTLAV